MAFDALKSLLIPVSKAGCAAEYSFSVKTDAQREELFASVRRFGVLRPVIALQEDGKFLLAAGSARLEAQRAAGREEIAALLFQGSAGELWDLVMEEALASGPLNPAETALYLKKRMASTGEDAGTLAQGGVLGKLGLAPKPSASADPLWIADLPREELIRFSTGEIPLGGVRLFMAAPREDALAVLRYTRARRIGPNKFFEIARWLMECAWRGGETVEQFAQRVSLEGFSGDPEALRQRIWELRYPELAKWSFDFGEDSARIGLPAGARVEHAKNFEGGKLRLVISFGSVGEVEKTVGELGEKLRKGDFSPLEKYLG